MIKDAEEDSLITSLETYSKLAPDRTYTYAVPGADHIYKVFSGNPEPANNLVERTVKWYAENLKNN